MAINLGGIWPCMRGVIPRLLAQGGGAIIIAASILGMAAAREAAAYRAAKHAVVLGLIRAAALDYAKVGIRVNAVCPGFTRMPRIDRVVERDPEAEGRMVKAEPMGRLGTPEEVAEAVLWPCSDAASFVTGHALAVESTPTTGPIDADPVLRSSSRYGLTKIDGSSIIEPWGPRRGSRRKYLTASRCSWTSRAGC